MSEPLDAIEIMEQVRAEQSKLRQPGDAGAPFPLEQAQRDYSRPRCNHAAIVDGDARTVVCRHCNVALDPIDVLLRIARDASWVRHMRAEKAELEREIGALKLERTKQRAAVRESKKRASRKAGA